VPDSTSVRDGGMDITRVNIPEAIVKSDPETSIFMDQIGLWCGPSTTLAIMPVRRGTRIFYSCAVQFSGPTLNFSLGDEWFLGLDCCHRRDETSVEGMSRKQNIEQLKGYFKDFAPAIQKLLSYVKEAHVWRMMETMPPT
jgi:salicylate hydroxylase